VVMAFSSKARSR
jgi:VIT1/CCC1 family predicted Fe2+/Mn2+ transporter